MISFLSKQAHKEIGSLSHGRHLNLRKVATLRRENRWLLPFARGQSTIAFSHYVHVDVHVGAQRGTKRKQDKAKVRQAQRPRMMPRASPENRGATALHAICGVAATGLESFHGLNFRSSLCHS
jgi:hypothetical protein